MSATEIRFDSADGQIFRPAFAAFYASLSDDQKLRLDAAGPLRSWWPSGANIMDDSEHCKDHGSAACGG
jgi:hypothetical protein